MKLVKTFPQNSMTSERFGNIDLLSFETYELKNDFVSLMNLTVDMIIEGLSYVEVMMIQNSNVDCSGICVRIILLIVCLSESF